MYEMNKQARNGEGKNIVCVCRVLYLYTYSVQCKRISSEYLFVDVVDVASQAKSLLFIGFILFILLNIVLRTVVICLLFSWLSRFRRVQIHAIKAICMDNEARKKSNGERENSGVWTEPRWLDNGRRAIAETSDCQESRVWVHRKVKWSEQALLL